MTNPGFFNHYDDPDEFWDDEPLAVPKKAPPASRMGHQGLAPDTNYDNSFETAPTAYPVSGSRPATPKGVLSEPAAAVPDSDRGAGAIPSDRLIGAGLIQMILDEGRLPVEVQVDRTLHARLDPRDFSAAVMTGYYVALWRRDAPIITSGNWRMLSARPSRRAEVVTLLNSRSLDEFSFLERVLRGHDEFFGTGPSTEYGSSSMTVSANMSRVKKFDIDVGWAARARPSDIGYDIIECSNQIRRQRPEFREDGSWSIHSDEQLETNLREYVEYLRKV